MLTIDTSGLFALLNRKDGSHKRAVAALESDRGPYLIPAGAIAEMAYMIERRLGLRVLDLFVADIEQGGFVFECGDEDLPRVRELMKKYANISLGFADAAVIACAERHGGRVLTFDVKDFGIVAREGKLTVLP